MNFDLESLTIQGFCIPHLSENRYIVIEKQTQLKIAKNINKRNFFDGTGCLQSKKAYNWEAINFIKQIKILWQRQKKLNRFKLALTWKGLVIPLISTRIIFCCVFGILISVADSLFGLPVNPPIFGTIIPSVVLGLLLVFRTNTA